MSDRRVCALCRSGVKDEVKYGEFMVKKEMAVHYYCLLLTSNLVQSGSDKAGFLGFLPKDIKEEAERIRDEICFFCRKPSANIACCKFKCRRFFHLACGIENGCVNQFLGTYRSFCHKHENYEKQVRVPKNEVCSICYDSLGEYKRSLIFRAPCCKSGWFHRWCLAKMALNSGYFFKCPLCNNKDRFRDHFLRRSIFVPDQDAAWEREPNAFADLLERPDTCTAQDCKCLHGRKYDAQNKPFELLICGICGAKAQHRACMTGKKSSIFTCSDCKELLDNTQSLEDNRSNEIEAHIDATDVEEKEIDIETVANAEDNFKRQEDTDICELSDVSKENIENIPQNNLKRCESLEMPVLSPYRILPIEDSSSPFPRNKRKRSNDSDLMYTSSNESLVCKAFKVDNLHPESDNSCASSSGISQSSGSETKKSRSIVKIKARLGTSRRKSKSASRQAPSDFEYTEVNYTPENTLLGHRRYSETLKTGYVPVQGKVSRSLSVGNSDYTMTANRFVRRSARLRKASQERSDSVSDSGIFNSSPTDGEFIFSGRRSPFIVLERFRSFPSLQSHILKYNFKAR